MPWTQNGIDYVCQQYGNSNECVITAMDLLFGWKVGTEVYTGTPGSTKSIVLLLQSGLGDSISEITMEQPARATIYNPKAALVAANGDPGGLTIEMVDELALHDENCTPLPTCQWCYQEPTCTEGEWYCEDTTKWVCEQGVWVSYPNHPDCLEPPPEHGVGDMFDLIWSPEQPFSGGTVNFNIKVRNIGDVDDTIWLRWYHNGGYHSLAEWFIELEEYETRTWNKVINEDFTFHIEAGHYENDIMITDETSIEHTIYIIPLECNELDEPKCVEENGQINLYECIDGYWKLTEINSPQCGYEAEFPLGLVVAGAGAAIAVAFLAGTVIKRKRRPKKA